MLVPEAMKLRRLAPVCFVLLAPLVGCEVEGPPPAVPAEPSPADVPPPPPPPAPTDTTAAGDGNTYVSGEYAIGADADTYDDNDPSALTDFHGALDAHGSWSDDPRYGTVWIPNQAEVGGDFTPYTTAGHWVTDDSDQYVWVSDYDWGWAPYHYGRWVYIDGSGWAWIPGREYRGAWVGWGWDDGYGYVGWYPMAPAFFWFGGVAIATTFYVGPRWSYCGRGDVFAGNVGAHVLTGAAAAHVAGSVHVAATPGVGPSTAKLGYSPSQVPHVSGTAAAGIARAQQFSRPSTATAMGGSPARVNTVGSAGTSANRGAGSAGGTGGTGGTGGSGAAGPSAQQRPASRGRTAPAPAAPAPRRSGGGGGGGGRGGGHGGHH
jgi:hypothetical protein